MSDAVRLRAHYGLKFNPFLPAIPEDDLFVWPGVDTFAFRLESLVRDGGFALLSGEPGLGKSKTLQYLASRLAHVGDVVVGVMERPQSQTGDFYRELGALFGVDLSPANRYGGFKALRARWRSHIKSNLFRPILLVDEAQEMPTNCLNELRLLSAAHFDSECLITTVLCGDTRLPDRFRARDLLPLGSRIRSRLILRPVDKPQLRDFLHHLLDRAGAPQLITDNLRDVLVDHAAGNPRILISMAADLLAHGLRDERTVLDEQLFLQVFDPQRREQRRKTK